MSCNKFIILATSRKLYGKDFFTNDKDISKVRPSKTLAMQVIRGITYPLLYIAHLLKETLSNCLNEKKNGVSCSRIQVGVSIGKILIAASMNQIPFLGINH